MKSNTLFALLALTSGVIGEVKTIENTSLRTKYRNTAPRRLGLKTPARIQDGKSRILSRKSTRARRQDTYNPYGFDYTNVYATYDTYTNYDTTIDTYSGIVSGTTEGFVSSQDISIDESDARQEGGVSVGGGQGVSSVGSTTGDVASDASVGSVALLGDSVPDVTTSQFDVSLGVQGVSEDVAVATTLLTTYVTNFPDAVLASGHSCSAAKILVAPCNTTLTVDKDMVIANDNTTIYEAQWKSKCPYGCKLTITFDGELITYAMEPKGGGKRPVWNGGIFGAGAYGVLFPDGNFLVMSVDNRIKFKSMADSPNFNDQCAADIPAATSRSLAALNY